MDQFGVYAGVMVQGEEVHTGFSYSEFSWWLQEAAVFLAGRRGGLIAWRFATMIELEVYAKGLRATKYLVELRGQMDMLPKVRYKIDVRHDLVYFEIDHPEEVSVKQIHCLFTDIGLNPRFVGQIPESLRADGDTVRLS